MKSLKYDVDVTVRVLTRFREGYLASDRLPRASLSNGHYKAQSQPDALKMIRNRMRKGI